MNEYVVYVNINHAIPVEEVHIEVLELKLLTLPMSSLIQSLCKIERLQTNGNPNCWLEIKFAFIIWYLLRLNQGYLKSTWTGWDLYKFISCLCLCQSLKRCISLVNNKEPRPSLKKVQNHIFTSLVVLLYLKYSEQSTKSAIPPYFQPLPSMKSHDLPRIKSILIWTPKRSGILYYTVYINLVQFIYS